MHVALLHDTLDEGDGPDRLDVKDQIAAVASALARLGHTSSCVPCDLDLAKLRRELEGARPDVVFNLVESLDGQDRLIALVPSLVESLGLPLTGSPSLGLSQSTSKLGSKRILDRAGLPVPPCLGCWPPDPASGGAAGATPESALPSRVLVKSVWEHGSPGLDDSAVLDTDVFAEPCELELALERLAPRFGGSCFAEPYIEGRELNLSLLTTADGSPRLLPPAEILFLDYPEDKPHIVGFPAKWLPDSFEYRSTPRTFDFPDEDREMLRELEAIALAAWHELGLAGWARVDFRVAANGRPWVLEANANPCLSPDAGFAAALERASISFDDTIDSLLDDALRRCAAVAPLAAEIASQR